MTGLFRKIPSKCRFWPQKPGTESQGAKGQGLALGHTGTQEVSGWSSGPATSVQGRPRSFPVLPGHGSHLPAQGPPHPLFPSPAPPLQHTHKESTCSSCGLGTAEGQFSPNKTLKCHFVLFQQRDAIQVFKCHHMQPSLDNTDPGGRTATAHRDVLLAHTHTIPRLRMTTCSKAGERQQLDDAYRLLAPLMSAETSFHGQLSGVGWHRLATCSQGSFPQSHVSKCAA